jgi:hypothetical protein
VKKAALTLVFSLFYDRFLQNTHLHHASMMRVFIAKKVSTCGVEFCAEFLTGPSFFIFQKSSFPLVLLKRS